MADGSFKFTPYRSCNCRNCRRATPAMNKFVKEVESHRKFRRKLKYNLKLGDYENFSLATITRS